MRLKMVAFPDDPFSRINDHVPALGYKPGSALRHAVLMCLGAAFLMAAMGLWMMPGAAGDPAMQLIRLMISGVAVVAGLACLASMDPARNDPEIQIDPARGQLRLIDRDAKGAPRVAAFHELDTLQDAVLENGFFSVRDARGRELVSMRVTDRRVHETLCRIFDLKA